MRLRLVTWALLDYFYHLKQHFCPGCNYAAYFTKYKVDTEYNLEGVRLFSPVYWRGGGLSNPKALTEAALVYNSTDSCPTKTEWDGHGPTRVKTQAENPAFTASHSSFFTIQSELWAPDTFYVMADKATYLSSGDMWQQVWLWIYQSIIKQQQVEEKLCQTSLFTGFKCWQWLYSTFAIWIQSRRTMWNTCSLVYVMTLLVYRMSPSVCFLHRAVDSSQYKRRVLFCVLIRNRMENVHRKNSTLFSSTSISGATATRLTITPKSVYMQYDQKEQQTWNFPYKPAKVQCHPPVLFPYDVPIIHCVT